LIAEIDEDGERGNLSSAIRVFVLGYFREKALRAQKSPRPASKNEPVLDAGAQRTENRQIIW